MTGGLLLSIQESLPEPEGSVFRLFPESASTMAGRVDLLCLVMVVVTGITTIGIFLTIFGFALYYRRRPGRKAANRMTGNTGLEILWSAVPLAFFLLFFGWGAWLYFEHAKPPEDALMIRGIGKQWMWKFWHPDGRGEINTLHVPMGRPVVVRLTSEDVIHDFYVPAFRTKMDVLPGRYTNIWFEATRVGEYHLFCAEYCGAKHSFMRGKVVVMSPRNYQEWLEGSTPETLAERGELLYQRTGCANCHRPGSPTRAPDLAGIYGREIAMIDGRAVVADDTYIRESIMNPRAAVVAGYEPVMPSYQGQLDEEEILALIAYIRSLEEE